MRQAVFEEDGEVIEGRFPFWNRHRPLFRGFADRQRGDLQSRVLVRGDLSVASQFADHTVDRFDGVGRRDRSADRHCADGTAVLMEPPR